MAGQSRLRTVLDAGTAAVSALRRGPGRPGGSRDTAPRGTGARKADARLRQRRLAREIAAYRTPAERLELDLILSRHTAEQVREIEEILRYQDAHRSYAERMRANPGTRV